MNMIRILLADDHSVVRAGLRALLGTAPDMQVVAEAENGQQAVAEAVRVRPNVVVLDLAMPLLNGMEAARQLAQRVPTAKVLILSSYNDGQHLRQAVEAGAAGYLVKDAAASDLLEAVRQTCNGGATFSPPLLQLLLQGWRDDGAVEMTKTASLSRRQAEVLQLIAEGYCTKQIASLLFISHKTAEKHRESLMRKLDVHKTAGLTRYAIANGIVETSRSADWLGSRTEPPGSAIDNRPRASGALLAKTRNRAPSPGEHSATLTQNP